jgi:isoleucyl-tRNA synthetase
MPELERYMLHLTAELDKKLRQAVNEFDFNSYTRLLADFANNDLSASISISARTSSTARWNAETGVQTDKRRAYRTVLDTLFHSLVRWLAPVLVFTSEEVWGTRFPDGGVGAPAGMAEIAGRAVDDGRWQKLRELRAQVTETIEPLRREKDHRFQSGSRRDRAGAARDARPACRAVLVSSVTQGDALTVARPRSTSAGRCWRLPSRGGGRRRTLRPAARMS